jgi:hypothetical protein
MAVSRADDIWPSLVNRRVDHESSRVQQTAFASVYHFPSMINKNKIGLVDQRKCLAERVHPEGVGIDWVSQSDMACENT